jgi:hypothetical protein
MATLMILCLPAPLPPACVTTRVPRQQAGIHKGDTETLFTIIQKGVDEGREAKLESLRP